MYLSILEGDRSDRFPKPVRPVPPRFDLHSIKQPKTPVGAKPEKGTRSHPTAKFLSSTQSLLRDAATSMKIRSAVLEGPRNPGRWPVLRKPPKLHAREDSRLHAVALDAVPASAS